MNTRVILTPILAGALCFGLYGSAVAEKPQVLALPADLHGVLLEEMHALKSAWTALMNAIPEGRWDAVHDLAVQIHDSFIMNQALDKKDIETLDRSLPEDFKRLDGEFHQQALQLAFAAKDEDHARAAFHVSRMLEACTNCHARYARARFPAFGEVVPTKHAH